MTRNDTIGRLPDPKECAICGDYTSDGIEVHTVCLDSPAGVTAGRGYGMTLDVKFPDETWAVVPKERLSDMAVIEMVESLRRRFPDKRWVVFRDPVELVALTSLDAAWREAHDAARERFGEDRYIAMAGPEPMPNPDSQTYRAECGMDFAVRGHESPTAALQALTAKLREVARA